MSDIVFAGAGVMQHNSPVPYYYQLSTYIESRIKSKEWQPGQMLPSEQEFCEKLGVSRTVVRQAMADLDRKGLVTKQNGKRSSIAYPKYDGGLIQNLRGFYEDAVRKGQTPSTRVLEFKLTGATPEVAEALQMKDGEPVVMLNRLRCLDGDPEVVVVTYLPEKKCPGLLEEDLTNASLYETLARKYGLVITHGFRTIEATPLDRADAKLFRLRAGSPTLLLKSIGLLADGTPLEYFVARHRGDRSKFHVRLLPSSDMPV
ncbi:MAG TPA: GntR family transcriptional regulator [Bryobacteraceae bacterium]|nr:GntR family transcriptional regulator [Bryobacteraceae bacterium]